jgi:hypothetical protein
MRILFHCALALTLESGLNGLSEATAASLSRL